MVKGPDYRMKNAANETRVLAKNEDALIIITKISSARIVDSDSHQIEASGFHAR
ncbi:MAG: hypothetical protein MZV64_62290 [Ignavibacteriales bacterium]|nr:hypothetical protein [Ignavibacteriales bacterium]